MNSKNLNKNKLSIALENMLKDEYHILERSTLRTYIDRSCNLDVYNALIKIARIYNVKSCTNLATLIFFAFEIETEPMVDVVSRPDKETSKKLYDDAKKAIKKAIG